MMNNATFSKEMLNVLAEMKGKTFKSYECVKLGTSMTYGKCRLNLGTFNEKVYELEKVYDEWSDHGNDYTEIKRTKKVL